MGTNIGSIDRGSSKMPRMQGREIMSGLIANAPRKSRTIGRRTVLKLAAGSLAGAIAAPRLIGGARAQSQTTMTVWTWGGVERFAPRVAAFKRLYPEAAS